MFLYGRLRTSARVRLVFGVILAHGPWLARRLEAADVAAASTPPSSSVIEAVLQPHDPDAVNSFGTGLALDGDVIVVGAPGDYSGDQLGAAYVFTYDPGTSQWLETKKLVPSDLYPEAPQNSFGAGVAVSGDTIVIGSSTEWIDADVYNAGAAYVFERNLGGPNNWGLRAKIRPADIGTNYRFGVPLHISEPYMVIGAIGDYVDADHLGATYVYERDASASSGWREVTKLVAPAHPVRSAGFGEAVAISGSTIAVRGDSTDTSFYDYVWTFDRDYPEPGDWGLSFAIFSDVTYDGELAPTVAISGDRAMIGFDNRPKARIYERSPGSFSPWVAYETLENVVDPYSYFGDSVAMDRNLAVVGDWTSSTGGSGQVHVYQRVASDDWPERVTVTPPAGDDVPNFGAGVVLDGRHVLVAAVQLHQGGEAFLFTVNVPCLPGSFGVDGDEPCEPCPPGTYQPDAGQSACLACPEGTFQTGSGALACIPCPGPPGHPCSDHGVCDDVDGDGTCQCDIGYVGLDCSVALCGNGIIDYEAGEACDNGANNSNTEPDACREDCQFYRCGDGVIDTGELCDDGELNSDVVPDACRQTCVPAHCGDGVVDSTEACDDGNRVSGDGCSSNCVVEPCGNGVIDPGEQCDGDNLGICLGGCTNDCTCAGNVPTVSAWGLVVLALALLALAKVHAMCVRQRDHQI